MAVDEPHALISFNVCQLVSKRPAVGFLFQGTNRNTLERFRRATRSGRPPRLSGIINEMAVGKTAATFGRSRLRDQRTISTDDTVNEAFSNAAFVRSAERLNFVMPM